MFLVSIEHRAPAVLAIPFRRRPTVSLSLAQHAGVRRSVPGRPVKQAPVPFGGAVFLPAGGRERIEWSGGGGLIEIELTHDMVPPGIFELQHCLMIKDERISAVARTLYDAVARRDHATMGEIVTQLAGRVSGEHLLPALERKPSIGRATVGRLASRMHARGTRLTVAELARQAGVGRSYFSRRFADLTGMPPQRYRQEVRLERARKLLAGTKRTISRVAIESGFADQSHLTRTFVERTGMTPLQYRSAARTATGP